jgi:hypothetical protein
VSGEPQSQLTALRPDIWLRGLDLARNLTGYTYARKDPLPNGTIYACGGGYTPFTKEEIEQQDQERRRRRDNPTKDEVESDIEVEEYRRAIYKHGPQRVIDQIEAELERLRQIRDRHTLSPVVYVPEGAMEWLLHEVGHYVAATPAERCLPNYGLLGDDDRHSAEREWQAWAFEEIILAPYGPAREMAPPTQRDGVGFSKAGPMPQFALAHAEREMRQLSIDVEQWRAIYGDWLRWDRSAS